jgi:hypothetical protein
VLARSRGIIAANLELIDAFFDDWADRFTWLRPRAGSIGFARLTVPGVRIDDWAAELVQAEGVLLAPGSVFEYPGNHFRLGFGRTDLPRRSAASRRTRRGRSDDTARSTQHRDSRRRRPRIARSRFYEALGWQRKSASIEGSIAWIGTADSTIGLFPWMSSPTTRTSLERTGRFGGITSPSTSRVPRRSRPGSTPPSPRGHVAEAGDTGRLGRTSGYFADPDGHPWEVAHNPGFPIDEDGRVRIP